MWKFRVRTMTSPAPAPGFCYLDLTSFHSRWLAIVSSDHLSARNCRAAGGSRVKVGENGARAREPLLIPLEAVTSGVSPGHERFQGVTTSTVVKAPGARGGGVGSRVWAEIGSPRKTCPLRLLAPQPRCSNRHLHIRGGVAPPLSPDGVWARNRVPCSLNCERHIYRARGPAVWR